MAESTRSGVTSKQERTCVFCGVGSVTREHIFPFWLRQAVGGGGAATHYRSLPADAPPPIGRQLDYEPPWSADDAEVVVRAVCANCNNTWLNELDHAVEPIAVPLIRNDVHPISDDERTLLATWATKIALLLEHTRSVSDLTRRRSLTPPSAYRELHDVRLPPAFARLWMLRVSPPIIGVWWRTGPVPVAWFAPDAARAIGAPNGSLTTFVAGMLGFQFLYAPNSDAYQDLVQRRSERGAKFMRLIWPPTEPLEWPPAAALRQDTLEVVAHVRFA
jgi:hypothetical protein